LSAPYGARTCVRIWPPVCLVALLIHFPAFSPLLDAGQISLSWQGGSGNYTNSNWCLAPCPAFPNNNDGSGNTYLAVIGTGNDNVTLDNTSSFAGVALDGMTIGNGSGSSTLNVADNLITLGSPASPGNLLTISAGGTLNVQSGGTLTLQNLTPGGGVTSIVTNNGTISLTGTSTAATLLLNDGGQGNVFDLTGSGTLSLSGQAQITGSTGNAAGLINDAGHTISGAGTISNLAGGSVAPGFTNNGTVNVINYASGNNNLIIDTTNAATPLSGFYNTGTGNINVADGATLTLRNTSGITTGFPAVFLNDGSITLGTAAAGAALVLDGGGQGTAFDLLSLSGAGQLNMNGVSTISGANGTEQLINDAGHTINVNSGANATISNLGAFVNNGSVNAAGNLTFDTSNGGSFYNQAGGAVTVGDGGTLTLRNISGPALGTAIFQNDGNINVGVTSGATLILAGGGATFDLQSPGASTTLSGVYGSLNLYGTSGIQGATGTESLINDTNHTISSGGTGLISNLASFTNNGTLSVAAGTLTVNAALTNWDGSSTLTGGSYAVAAGATLQLSTIGSQAITTLSNANVSVGSGGLLTGDGTTDALRSIASIQNSTLYLNGVNYNLPAPGSLSITSQASVSSTPAGGISSLTLDQQSQVTAGDLLSQAGVLGSAGVTVQNGSTLTVSSLTTSTAASGNSTVLVANGFGVPNSGSTLHVTGSVYLGGGSGAPMAPDMSQGNDSLSIQGGSKVIVGGNFSNNNGGAFFNIGIPGTPTGASVVEVLGGSTLNVTGSFSQNQSGAGFGVSQLNISGAGSTVTVGGLANSTYYTPGFGPQSDVVIKSGGTLNVLGTNPDGTSTFTNIPANGVLTGGGYFIGQGSSLNYTGSSNITAIGANTALILDNAGTGPSQTGQILNKSADAISNSLATNNGFLTLSNNASLSLTAGSFTNNVSLTTGLNIDGAGGNNTFNVTGDIFNTSPGIVNITGTGDQVSASGSFINDGAVTIAAGASIAAGTGFDLVEGTLSGAGILQGNLDQTGGTFNPGGDPQSFSVIGFYDLNGGTLQLDLDTDGQIDNLIVTGEVSLSGSLDIALLDGFVPQPGVFDDVIDAGSIDPAFNHLSFDDVADGLEFTLQPDAGNPTSFDLVVTATPEPGTLAMLLGALLISSGAAWRGRRRRLSHPA